jgi:hypothetical protein
MPLKGGCAIGILPKYNNIVPDRVQIVDISLVQPRI